MGIDISRILTEQWHGHAPHSAAHDRGQSRCQGDAGPGASRATVFSITLDIITPHDDVRTSCAKCGTLHEHQT